MKRLANIYLLSLTLLFFLIISFLYKDNIFSQRFVDEEENFAVGKYLLQGEKIYDDILTSHQPLGYIFSASIQNIAQPQDVYFLIKDHRLAVLIWSLIWSVVLILSFGRPALFFIVIFELTKSLIFGNLFLPEAFSVYPLVYLLGLTLKNNFNLIKKVTFGFCIGICTFLLQPIWPLLVVLILLYIFKFKREAKAVVLPLISLAFVVILVLYFAPFPAYIKSFYLNLTYTIPSYHNSYFAEPWIVTFIKSFFSPFLALIYSHTSITSTILKLTSLLFFINIIYLLLKRNYFQSLIIFILLGLANLRFVYPGNESYAAGLLPWYGSYIFITLLLADSQLQTKLKFINISLIILVLFTAFRLGGDNLLKKGDPQKDYFINFSTHEDRGRAIKIMGGISDTLFVSPDNWLVYWASDTNHLPKLMGYYAWMAGLPQLHQEILTAFDQKPPTFFYCDDCKDLDLGKSLIKYQEIKKSGGSTRLYVLPERINTLTTDQKSTLNYYKYDF